MTTKTLSKLQKELIKVAKSQRMNESEIQEMLKTMSINTSIKAKASNEPLKPVTVIQGNYEGKATISLLRGESSFINRPFTFGKAKAQMIVESFESIKAFAESKE